MQATQGTSVSDPVPPGVAPVLKQSSVSGSSAPGERDSRQTRSGHSKEGCGMRSNCPGVLDSSSPACLPSSTGCCSRSSNPVTVQLLLLQVWAEVAKMCKPQTHDNPPPMGGRKPAGLSLSQLCVGVSILSQELLPPSILLSTSRGETDTGSTPAPKGACTQPLALPGPCSANRTLPSSGDS